MQSLNGKVAVLNRFVLRATNKCLPFFCTLKKSFEWMAECPTSIRGPKSIPLFPTVAKPSKLREELFLYLAVSPAAVNAALIKEEDRV